MGKPTLRPDRIRLAAVVALVCFASSSPRGEVRREPPIMVSAAAPSRQALIVAPADGRVAADAGAYRDLLRRLGFEVATLVPESRADLDGELKRYAASVRPGAEALVLMLGTTLAHEHDLYVTAVTPTAEVAARPALYGAEGVRLGNALHRIAARELIVVVDACRAPDDACARATAALGDGVSAIVATRTARPAAGDAPRAGVASLRGDLLPLMREPGLSLLDAYGRLRNRLEGTDMALVATPSLSRGFVFLPTDFLARLPTPCNSVERGADLTSLGGRDLDGMADACRSAARSWDFSTYFVDRLAIVREQTSARRAVSVCKPSEAAEVYLRDYPAGTYRGDVERFEARCEDAARAAAIPPRAPAGETPAEAPRRTRTALLPRGDQAASFSCDGPLREPVAQLICADAELAAADFGLGFAYRTNVRSLFPGDRRAAVNAQVAWLRRRDAACGIPDAGDWSLADLAPFKPCLLVEIEKRTRELSP